VTGSGINEHDRAAVAAQLGRPPRGISDVAWRCPCGNPGVVATLPALPDGTPFPTTYYLTCRRATAACSGLESAGVMAEMQARLATDPPLAAAYEAAHHSYLADRDALAEAAGLSVPQIDGVSAGGMPDRVKCLHVLAAHALAKGPGVNPLGDEVVAALGDFWTRPCVEED
jgi:hypothetical protein